LEVISESSILNIKFWKPARNIRYQKIIARSGSYQKDKATRKGSYQI
jgi:hypothetical protein